MSTFPTFAFVFECEDGYYFVGTSTNPARELRDHSRTDFHPWTTLHPPRRMLTCVEGGDEEAQTLVERWMATVGVDRVRGGAYQEVSIPEDEKVALRVKTRMMRASATTD